MHTHVFVEASQLLPAEQRALPHMHRSLCVSVLANGIFPPSVTEHVGRPLAVVKSVKSININMVFAKIRILDMKRKKIDGKREKSCEKVWALVNGNVI